MQALSKKLCFEYTLPKSMGLTPEECVLFASALDLEKGSSNLPLLREDLVEIGIEVRSTGFGGDVIRILAVTSEE